jgi:hypothetical protein
MMLTTLVIMTMMTEDSDASSRARRLFDDGRSHLKAGRVAAACDAFAGSLNAQRTIGTLLNLASCSEQLERYTDAWRAAEEAGALANREHDARLSIARAIESRVERFLAFVEIDIEGAWPSADVVVNGVWSPLAETVTQLVVPLGDIDIVVRAPGRLSFRMKKVLASKEVLRLRPWRDSVVSVDDAARYTWFATQRLGAEVKLKVSDVESRYPYFGIPSNGCPGGTTFVKGQLVDATDGLAALTSIVVRTSAASSGKAGSTQTFRGLVRAGLGQDRTPVFCVAPP